MGLLYSKHPVRRPRAESNSNMPKKKYRRKRSYSLEGSIDARRKFRDMGGIGFRCPRLQELDVKKHLEDIYLPTTPLLHSALVENTSDAREEKMEELQKQKPKVRHEPLALLKEPDFIPSVVYVQTLFDMIHFQEKRKEYLKSTQEETKSSCEKYRMYGYRAELPENVPEATETWAWYTTKEREHYLKQIEWFKKSADEQFKKLKDTQDEIFELDTLSPLLRRAIENCFAVAVAEANLNPINVHNIWELPLNDMLFIYRKLKFMIFKVRLAMEKNLNISRTKEALRANNRPPTKTRMYANCIGAQCCKGKCKEEGKKCHRERFYGLEKGGTFLLSEFGRRTIICPKGTLDPYSKITPYDPDGTLVLRDPAEMAAEDYVGEEPPYKIKDFIDVALQQLRSEALQFKYHGYQMLQSFHQIYDYVYRINHPTEVATRQERQTRIVGLPLFSRYILVELYEIVRNMTRMYKDIPTSLEVSPDVNELEYPGVVTDEDKLESMMASIKIPATHFTRSAYKDLRSENYQSWRYDEHNVNL